MRVLLIYETIMEKACTQEGMRDTGECVEGKRRNRNDINTVLMHEIINT